MKSATKNSTKNEIEMDLTSTGEELSTGVKKGLVSPPFNVVHTTTAQEPNDSSSTSIQISLEDKIVIRRCKEPTIRDPTDTE